MRMTDQPYTDTDLRAEAARQHAALTEDPGFMGVGEQMEDVTVDHTDDGDTSLTWSELLVPQGAGASFEAFRDAQHKIHELINGAADVSKWAIDLGADGLEPEDHTLAVDGDDKPLVRLHCAFHPDLDSRARIAFLSGLAKAMADAL